MRDPVADILAERSRGGRGLGAAIAVSFVLHAAGSAAAVITAWRQPPPKAASTLNIRFAPIPSAPVVPRQAAQPKPAPRIEEPKPQPVKAPTKPVEEPKRNVAPPSTFGRSTKKAADVAPPPPAPRTPPASAAAPGITSDVAVGQAGVTGIEGGDFPYTVYLDRMKTLVGSRWIRPAIGVDAKAIVYFRIERDGTIRDVSVTSPSGNGSFDRAALRAVLEASPLPPLPFGYSGHYLGVHLTFR